MNVPPDHGPPPQSKHTDSLGTQFLSLPWWSLFSCWAGVFIISSAFRHLYALFTRDPSLIGQNSSIECFAILGCLSSLVLGVIQQVCEHQGMEIKPSSWSAPLIKTAGILFAIGFGIVILNIAIPAMYEVQLAQISQAQQKEQLNSPWRRYLFGEEKWSISVPADWKEGSQTTPAAGFIMLAAPNLDYLVGVVADSNDDTSPVSSKELTERRVQEMRAEGMGHVTIGKAYDYLMAGFPTQATSLTLRRDQETYFIDYFVYQSGPERLEIQIWRKTAGAPSQNEVLQRILQSVSAH